VKPCTVCNRLTRLVVVRHRVLIPYCRDHYGIGLGVEAITVARQRRSAREAAVLRYVRTPEVA
jgi:hypothetical protein